MAWRGMVAKPAERHSKLATCVSPQGAGAFPLARGRERKSRKARGRVLAGRQRPSLSHGEIRDRLSSLAGSRNRDVCFHVNQFSTHPRQIHALRVETNVLMHTHCESKKRALTRWSLCSQKRACDGEKTCAACVDRRNSGKCSKLEHIRKQYVM